MNRTFIELQDKTQLPVTIQNSLKSEKLSLKFINSIGIQKHICKINEKKNCMLRRNSVIQTIK